MYRSIVKCFPSCAYVLQNEQVSIVKSFKYDYWFSELLGRWSVGRWSVDLIKPMKRHVCGSDFACALLSRFIFLFWYFNFFFIDSKEEINLIARRNHSKSLTIPKDKYYNFKQNKTRAYCDFIRYFFYLLKVTVDVTKKHVLLKNSS